MNVLVIGNGGREHAILLALKKSKRVNKLYCMKGNAGTAEIAQNVDVDYMNIPAVVEYAKAHPEIDYYVVAPDDPLAIGVVDALEGIGKRCFGPRKNAAVIEASKAFSKELMKIMLHCVKATDEHYRKEYETSSEIAHSSPLLLYSNKSFFYYKTLVNLYESFFRLERAFSSLYLPAAAKEEQQRYLNMRKLYFSQLKECYQLILTMLKKFVKKKEE